jgi:ketosteroid isomerase-like protein
VSQENVEVARAIIAAGNAGDIEGYMELVHPDVEMTLPRNLLEGGVYRGRDGLRRAFDDLAESWEVVRIAVDRIEDTDDCVVVLGRGFNTGREGGPSVDYELAILMRFREGQMIESRPFLDHSDALRAVGLEE